MTEATRLPARTRNGWPMTAEAWERLIDEVSRLRRDVSTLAGAGLEEGVVHLPVAHAARRLQTLIAAQAIAELTDDNGCVAIGRRATVQDEQGEAMSFSVVFPGDGDPTEGWVSADSPLGAAVLGGHAGDVVHVDAPAGPWSAVIVGVD